MRPQASTAQGRRPPDPPDPPRRRISWQRTYRIIPTRYPPIALFERVADPEDWEALVEIESLTNPRIRDEIGEISLVSARDRVSGEGACWVMAAFTHVGFPSRFTDGSYGVYYAARTVVCAVEETAFHWGKFYAATSEPPCTLDMRVLQARIDASLHDIRGAPRGLKRVYDPDDYGASQSFAAQLRGRSSNGLAYDSVRHDGHCAALFIPRAIKEMPRGDRFLMYHWDGASVDRYFDYAADRWITR